MNDSYSHKYDTQQSHDGHFFFFFISIKHFQEKQ